MTKVKMRVMIKNKKNLHSFLQSPWRIVIGTGSIPLAQPQPTDPADAEMRRRGDAPARAIAPPPAGSPPRSPPEHGQSTPSSRPRRPPSSCRRCAAARAGPTSSSPRTRLRRSSGPAGTRTAPRGTTPDGLGGASSVGPPCQSTQTRPCGHSSATAVRGGRS